jgi:hypothetical protein
MIDTSSSTTSSTAWIIKATLVEKEEEPHQEYIELKLDEVFVSFLSVVPPQWMHIARCKVEREQEAAASTSQILVVVLQEMIIVLSGFCSHLFALWFPWTIASSTSIVV